MKLTDDIYDQEERLVEVENIALTGPSKKTPRLDRGVVFTTDETMYVQEFELPLHKAMEPILGGSMEITYPRGLPHPLVMVVNDCGLLLDLPINPIGCVWRSSGAYDPIVGNIIIMRQGFRNGEPDIVGLTDAEIAQVKAMALSASHGEIRDLDAPEPQRSPSSPTL